MNNLVPLSSIATLKTGPFGTQFSANEYVESGIPVINVRNIGYGEIIVDDLEYVSEETRQRLYEHTLKTGDIVFGRKGSVDRHAYIEERYNGWVQGSDCIRVRCSSDVNTRYLSHFLKLDFVKNQINNAAVGSTMASLNTDILGRIRIILPCREIQDRIEQVLTVLEDKIENNALISIQMESMAKTLYDYWFVQFDFPDANGKPYRASGGEMVWNEQLKREIPKGWEVQPLTHYLDCNKHTVKRNEWNSYIDYLDTGSLTSNRIGELQRYETIEEAPSRAQRIVYKNDILYSTVRPNQCHYGLIKSPSPNLVASSGFACLASKFGAEYNDLFYLFLTSERIVNRLTAIAASSVSAYPSINPSDVMNLLIALPEKLDSIRALSNRLCDLLSAVTHFQTENKELTRLRDWLLPMLMNGQATVAPAEPAPKLQVLQPEKPACDPRFDRWLQTQGVAARGTVDEQTLHDIFDAMDDDDKQ